MAIRVTSGTVIVAAPPLGVTNLNVPLIKQEQTEWCWAACADMVSDFYGNAAVCQCEFANWLFGLSDCCSVPSSSLCNRPAEVTDVCGVYNAFGVQCASSSGTISLAALQYEIDQGRPIEAGLAWTGGGGHAVLVYGYDDHGKVHVHDPMYGQVAIPYTDLVSAYGHGSWFWTFTNLRI